MNNNFPLIYNESINNRIQNICKPLNDFGITSFTHTKCFLDGKVLRIASNLEWSKKFFDKNFHVHPLGYQKDIQDTCKEVNDLKIFIWNGTPQNEIYEALYQYNIWNGITLCEQSKDYISGWSFGSTVELDNMVNFYLSNLSILKHFVLYFKDVANDILDISDQHKLYTIPKFLSGSILDENEIKLIKEFFSKTMVKHYFLNESKHTSISLREFECLFHLCMGNSVKEIALILHLSPRTVETYLNNIKNKYNVYLKSELSKLFLKNIYKWLY